jgi:CHAT domain-containing protein
MRHVAVVAVAVAASLSLMIFVAQGRALAEQPAAAAISRDVAAGTEYGKLLAQGRMDEAAEILRQRILAAGPSLHRQSGYCNALAHAYDFSRLRECLATLAGMLDTPPTAREGFQATMEAIERNAAPMVLFMGYFRLGDVQAGVRWARVHVDAQKALGLKSRDANALRSAAVGMVYLAQGYARLGESAKLDALAAELAEIEKSRAAMGGTDLGGAELGVRVSIALARRDYRAALAVMDRQQQLNQALLKKSNIDPESGWGKTATANLQLQRLPLLLKLGEYAQAGPMLADLEARPGISGPASMYGWRISYYRGVLDEAEGKAASAVENYRESLRRIENARRFAVGEEDRIRAADDKQEVYAGFVRLLVREGRDADALETAERGKSRALADLLATRQEFGAKRKDGATRQVNAALDAWRKAEAASAGLATGAMAAQSAEAESKSRSVAADMRERIRRESPEAASLLGVESLTAGRIQAQLAADETLVEYYGGREALYAFVVDRAHVRAVSLDPKALALVEPFRQSIQGQGKDTLKRAAALYDALIRPLGLPQAGRLVIVPHASLHYLPFAALHDGSRFLVDSHELRMAPSASVLAQLAARKPPAANGQLVFGNPDLGRSDYDLPGAEEEARRIAGMRNGKLLLRAAASRAALEALAPDYPYIHLATHGVFDARAPRSSGLLLANKPGAASPRDGILSVDDIYQLDLHADLVTLSACETALSAVQTGDDVVGLTRGFFFAGARSIVSSLWQVDDAATEQLMVEFYRALPGMSTAAALRRAQLAVKQRSGHPFFWAAFQLSGFDAAKAPQASPRAAQVRSSKR